ncbi:hydroxyproline-rich glycoprotein family protein [Abeliophyllum distichum]|uniref:Hydroxyproline-rich glycoprotein family protein n=1 Tax=Abeliophyllum distichum TaxID=126358 RepID=A0ABD1UKJ2_9LAMI
MRGRSSSKKGISKNGGIEIEKVDELNQEPHLSGAYIRSLVKQLTSSRTKDSAHPKMQENLEREGISSTKMADGFSETVQESPQQHKKQVRRRLHTSKPYQDRLLNMAEARREIVTALKFHRAAMKQASEQQQQKNSRVEQESLHTNAALVTDFCNFEDNFSYSSGFCPPYNPYHWDSSTIAPPVLVQENMNFPLPNQTLGLNLNFHDFNNLDTILYHNNNNPSIYSYSSPSSSSSSPPLLTREIIPSMAAVSQEGPSSMVAADVGDLGLHPVMDDKEMAEIRSIGEQHQMEFNDSLNLVTSAWWFKFLNATEIGPEAKSEEYGASPFDEVIEFPAWLNANESCLQNLNDYYSEYLQDPALPCMDIEEIEGMDGDWLA